MFMSSPSPLWPYVTPGISDDLFESLPGIPMSQREIRLLLLAHLRLQRDSTLWDIGGRGGVALSGWQNYCG
jgi:cobalt-precorrin-6B (C15)-methyltransferase